MVLAQPLPEELQQGLLLESRRLAEASGSRLAVRSSGGREDLGRTFAGQYESFLGVAPEEVPSCWRQVVASQFGERAMIYFKLQGLCLEDAAMGVLVQRLVDARAAGVLFTSDPEGGDPDRIVVNATWGLAADLVSGRVRADEFIISKENGRLLRASTAPKEQCLTLQGGRLTRLPVAQEKLAAPTLQEGDLAQLAALARSLEGYFGGPQVVEWAQDQAGRLFVIQSRHLPSPEAGAAGRSQAEEPPAGARVLLAGGRTGSPGVGAGPVLHLPEGGRPSQVPQGVVLVASQATPQLAPALPRVAAIVAEVGSATGHLALVAREYGVPVLVDVPRAGQVLPEGQMVTVDAEQGRVYGGRVEELLSRRAPRAPQAPPPFLENCRAVLDLIIPLTLVDRRSPSFRPENCRTYHDITRFAHEEGHSGDVRSHGRGRPGPGAGPQAPEAQDRPAPQPAPGGPGRRPGRLRYPGAPGKDHLPAHAGLVAGHLPPGHHLGRAGAGERGRLSPRPGPIRHPASGAVLGQDLRHCGGQLRQLRLPPGLPFPKRGLLPGRGAGEQLYQFHL